jgi:hypothetical protein
MASDYRPPTTEGFNDSCHIGGKVVQSDPLQWAGAGTDTARLGQNGLIARACQSLAEFIKIVHAASKGGNEDDGNTASTHADMDRGLAIHYDLLPLLFSLRKQGCGDEQCSANQKNRSP